MRTSVIVFFGLAVGIASANTLSKAETAKINGCFIDPRPCKEAGNGDLYAFYNSQHADECGFKIPVKVTEKLVESDLNDRFSTVGNANDVFRAIGNLCKSSPEMKKAVKEQIKQVVFDLAPAPPTDHEGPVLTLEKGVLTVGSNIHMMNVDNGTQYWLQKQL